MPIQRMTAKKVRISELMSGKWVKREGMEPSFVITDSGEKVSRARLLGTVVGSFLAEDGNFGSITLDDGTDTIRAKTFKTVKPLDSFKPGELVELTGKVREYNQEIYVIPEIITSIKDPNMELLRRIELVKKARDLKARPPEATPEEQSAAVTVMQSEPARPASTGAAEAGSSADSMTEKPSDEDTQKHPHGHKGAGTLQGAGKPSDEDTLPREHAGAGKPSDEDKQDEKPKEAPREGKPSEGDSQKEGEKKKEDDAELRKEILAVIGSDSEGAEYNTIIEKVGAPENRVESVLNEILAEGICYEPTPGKVKKI